jgi:hypothetical protein
MMQRILNKSFAGASLLLFGVASLPVTGHAAEVGSGLAQQPNVVVIIADDMGYADMGFLEQALSGLFNHGSSSIFASSIDKNLYCSAIEGTP